MNTSYNLTISNEINTHFENILNSINTTNNVDTISQARKNFVKLKATKTNPYVLKHIDDLEKMLQMFEDKQWSLSELSQSDRHYILSACQYLIQEDDVIPDNIPNIGLLDDCIIIDIASNKTRKQLNNYHDFKHTKAVYSKDEEFNVNDWRKTKQQEKFSRIRNRRNKR